MPLNPQLHRVLIIGSGPIVIGQAAEFDYAGSQACRALKQAGLEVILVNPNPATIMTDRASADRFILSPRRWKPFAELSLRKSRTVCCPRWAVRTA